MNKYPAFRDSSQVSVICSGLVEQCRLPAAEAAASHAASWKVTLPLRDLVLEHMKNVSLWFKNR